MVKASGLNWAGVKVIVEYGASKGCQVQRVGLGRSALIVQERADQRGVVVAGGSGAL